MDGHVFFIVETDKRVVLLGLLLGYQPILTWMVLSSTLLVKDEMPSKEREEILLHENNDIVHTHQKA